MCTPEGAGCALTGPGGGFASVADALRAGRAAAAYLNSPAARDLDGAAANGLLRRFDADYGHDGDGYATTAA